MQYLKALTYILRFVKTFYAWFIFSLVVRQIKSQTKKISQKGYDNIQICIFLSCYIRMKISVVMTAFQLFLMIDANGRTNLSDAESSMIHQRGCQDGLAIVLDALKETKEIVQSHTWGQFYYF